MRRARTGLALLVLVAAAPAGADGIAFQYTIEREREGNVIESSFLRGFDTRDGLRLRVKVQQPSYCYVIMGEPDGGYRLAFPDPDARPADLLAANQWAKIPKSTFVRMGDDPGIERMYLVVASQRIPELEDGFARGSALLAESVALDVRDRYHGDGSYSRDLDGATVSVKYRPRALGGTSVIVEEIALRAR